MKIGLIGPTGQLGSAITRHQPLSEIDFDIIAADRTQLDLGRSALSIRNALSIFESVDVIINAAAYTAVDDAETQQDLARAVNDIAPGIIAQYCKTRDIPLIHISTDYVFDGRANTPYGPEDEPNPQSVYGHTKHLGEISIQASGCEHVILRTSWLYDVSHKNFVTTMLKLSQNRDRVQVVSDQFGRPTFVDELARAVIIIAQTILKEPQKHAGVYHFTDKGPVISWADFARAIFNAARPHIGKDMIVENISSAEYQARAIRPAYSALATSSFEHAFNIELQDWQLNLKTAIMNWHRETIGK